MTNLNKSEPGISKTVKPLTSHNEILGTIAAPASKSMMQRAIAAAVMAKTPTVITNATYSNDSIGALRVARALGADVQEGHAIHITGGINPTGEPLNVGESGLGIRMFTPIASLADQQLTLTGEGSLLTRPVTMIEDPLKQLGITVTTTNGCPPLTVKGPLKGGTAKVDGSISSQFLTGLLMALPAAPNDSCLQVKNLKSTPYIDMTLSLLNRFGVDVRHTDYKEFHIKGNQEYRTGQYHVEGDWSGAAFILAAAAVAGTVTVTGLDIESLQADRKIIEALIAAGANVGMNHGENNSGTVIVGRNRLKAFKFDATHCPDLFPPLAALACHCDGVTEITGVERLTHKESNRADALTKEFTAIGGDVTVNGNMMYIKGKTLNGGQIDSHNDHRIAMAGAIAALRANNPVIINGPQCVAKSYPRFWHDLKSIGGQYDE